MWQYALTNGLSAATAVVLTLAGGGGSGGSGGCSSVDDHNDAPGAGHACGAGVTTCAAVLLVIRACVSACAGAGAGRR